MTLSKIAFYRLPLGAHLAFFAALSVVMSVALPYLDGMYATKDTGLRNLGGLYAITIGFLLSISMARRRSLEEHILVELNKVRRINHLAKNIALLQPELQAWYDELHGHLEKYLEYFRAHDLEKYAGSNLLFRRVTRLVYSLPSRGFEIKGGLYGDLLSTTGSASEAREYVSNLNTPSIGRFQLGVVVVISLALGVITTMATTYGWWSRLGVAGANFCSFLVLEMFYEYEFIATRLKRRLADHYLHNLHQLVETLPAEHGSK